MPDTPDKELQTDEARQGSRGKPVLWVLIAGLVIGVIYVFSMMMFPVTDEVPEEPGIVETEEVPESEQEDEPASEADNAAGQDADGGGTKGAAQ